MCGAVSVMLVAFQASPSLCVLASFIVIFLFFCTFYHRVFGNSGEKLHQLAGVPLLTNTRAELAARQRRRGRK